MKAMNEMKLTFPSRSANEAFARAAVASFIAQLDPAVDELADIRTALYTHIRIPSAASPSRQSCLPAGAW